MFVRLTGSNSHKIIGLHGKLIDIIRLPKYMHQDNTKKFSVAMVVIHDLSKHPDSFDISLYSNSLQFRR